MSFCLYNFSLSLDRKSQQVHLEQSRCKESPADEQTQQLWQYESQIPTCKEEGGGGIQPEQE